jgi:hypothetical protein
MDRFAKALALFFIDLFTSMHVNLWSIFSELNFSRLESTYYDERRAFSCSFYFFFMAFGFGLIIEPEEGGVFRWILPIVVLATSYFFFCYKQRYLKVLNEVKSRNESKSYKLASVLGILFLFSLPVAIYLTTFRIID